MEKFRSETGDNFFVNVVVELRIGCFFIRNLQREVFKVEENISTFFRKRSVDEVHLRSAYEACDKYVDRHIIKLLRCIDLLDNTVFHNNDTGSHCHSLNLVMRNVYERRADLLVKLCKLGSHRGTKLCIKVGQRFVKKEDLRLTDDSTSERDTLFLTAGQSLRSSVKEVGNIKYSCGLFDSPFDFFLRSFSKFETERHIFVNGHMRIQSVVLEHHRYISVLRRDVVYELIAYKQFAVCDFFKSRDHSKGGRLSAARRANKNYKFLVLDLKAEIRYSRYAAGIFLEYVLERYTCHIFLLLCSILLLVQIYEYYNIIRANKMIGLFCPNFSL